MGAKQKPLSLLAIISNVINILSETLSDQWNCKIFTLFIYKKNQCHSTNQPTHWLPLTIVGHNHSIVNALHCNTLTKVQIIGAIYTKKLLPWWRRFNKIRREKCKHFALNGLLNDLFILQRFQLSVCRFFVLLEIKSFCRTLFVFATKNCAIGYFTFNVI